MARIKELSALRGLAAFAVLLNHLLIVFPLFVSDTSRINAPSINMVINLIKYTPLHIVWDGTGAVRLFFILSGFVLALAFWGAQPPTYLNFLTKRICRLYLPYLVALIVGATLDMFLAGHHALPEMGAIINMQWQHRLTTQIMLQHLLLIDAFYHPEINDVFWTLVHEMRLSLIFPVLIALAQRQTARQFLVTCCMMSLVGYVGVMFFTGGILLNTDYFQSLSFVWLFALGIVLAQHRERLIRWFCGLSPTSLVILSVVALCCFSYRWLLPENLLWHGNMRDDILNALGGSWFIIAAQASPRMQAWLRGACCQWLGDISYSLYLFHMPILLGAVWLLHAVLPLWVIVVGVGVVSIGVATVMHRLVEVPTQQLGRWLALKTTQRRAGGYELPATQL